MIDFKELVGSRVGVVARVVRINRNDRVMVDYVLIKAVYVNGKFFRDHNFIKYSRRLKGIKKGDIISFTSKLEEYIDSENITKKKIGFKSIRSVVKCDKDW